MYFGPRILETNRCALLFLAKYLKFFYFTQKCQFPEVSVWFLQALKSTLLHTLATYSTATKKVRKPQSNPLGSREGSQGIERL